ncbi:type II toxin-antitoxin system RelE/ParE family toxin [Sphingomonas sp. 4RDLI-65]|uniref:type II toxin-antitoxin system RelE/ParE family toxin n=1 Tax=Sphingomonas sp. 4RDLI-65 TaxID=3111641 RepID=UPI003C26D1C8
MTRAIWSASALADLDEIDRYFREDSPDHARHVGDVAIAAVRMLADNPYLGPVVEGDLRKWSARGIEYVILYRPMADGIDVVRLMHARQDRPFQL